MSGYDGRLITGPVIKNKVERGGAEKTVGNRAQDGTGQDDKGVASRPPPYVASGHPLKVASGPPQASADVASRPPQNVASGHPAKGGLKATPKQELLDELRALYEIVKGDNPVRCSVYTKDGSMVYTFVVPNTAPEDDDKAMRIGMCVDWARKTRTLSRRKFMSECEHARGHNDYKRVLASLLESGEIARLSEDKKDYGYRTFRWVTNP